MWAVDDLELKPLLSAGIGKALEKANRYRLLNEPGVSESICRDILLADAGHVEAQTVLLLALTDMFPRGIAQRYEEALSLARALPDSYEQAYYTGIVYERRAKAHYHSSTPASGPLAYDWMTKAMAKFEEAMELRPEGDDEAVLRWNNCVRRLRAHPDLRPEHDHDEITPHFGE